MAMSTKAVWFKHRDSMFFPSWALSLAMSLVAVPLQLLDATLWSVITYFM